MKFIPQPHDAVFPLLCGEQLQTLPSCRMIGCVADILEDGRHARKPVDAGIDDQTQFVYQSLPRAAHRSIMPPPCTKTDRIPNSRPAASEPLAKVGRIIGDDVRNPSFPQMGEVLLRCVPSYDNENVVAPSRPKR